MSDWDDQANGPVPAPYEPAATGDDDPGLPHYLYISGVRLILMDVLTAGIFEQYWLYRNWRYLRDRDKLDISPFWRTWFNFFFIHELFRRMREDPRLEAAGNGPSPEGWYASLWIAMSLATAVMSRLPDENAGTLAGLLGLSSFFCLLPAQRFVNRANAARVLRPGMSPWTGWQYAVLVIGLIINVASFMAS